MIVKKNYLNIQNLSTHTRFLISVQQMGRSLGPLVQPGLEILPQVLGSVWVLNQFGPEPSTLAATSLHNCSHDMASHRQP